MLGNSHAPRSWLTAHRWPDKACLAVLLDALARALEHDFPLAISVRSMLDHPAMRWTWVRYLSSPPGRSWRSDIVRTAWRDRFEKIADDLERGVALSETLERHAGKYMPPHFVVALRAAERRERLAQVVPMLARTVNDSLAARVSWRAALVYPVVLFATMFTILSGLMVFIVPKFAKIFDEMLPGEPLPLPTNLVILASNFLKNYLVLGLAAGMALFLLVSVAKRVRMLQPFCEQLGFLVPFAGTTKRRLATLDAVHLMAGLIAAGEDMADAAECGASAARSAWVRRRLARFAQGVAAGRPWTDEWRKMRLGTPLHDWVIVNAAAREAPREGFELLTTWLAADIARRTRRMLILIEPCLMLCNAIVIGTVVYSLFLPLIRLISLLGG